MRGSFAHIDFDQVVSRLGSTSLAEDPRRMRITGKAMRTLVEFSENLDAPGWTCALPVIVLGPEDLGGDMDLARAVHADLVSLNPGLVHRLVVGECSLIFRVPRYM